MTTGKTNLSWRRGAKVTALAVLAAAVLFVVAPPGGPAEIRAMGPVAEGVSWTESQAQAAAARSGTRVEVAGKAGPTEAVWANPDLTFTRETHAQPFRVKQGGAWVPVDTTMVRYADGSVGPKAAATAMRFSGGADMPLATVSRAGRVMSLSWPGGLPAPVLSGDTATYALAAGLDLVVRAAVTGYSHVLVVKSPAALKDPRLAEISYGLHGKDLTFTAAEDRLLATDTGTGGLVFEAPVPKMWDAGDPGERAGDAMAATQIPDSAIRSTMAVRVQGQTLTLVPDARMLARADLRFPLYLDPFTNPTSNTSWAMVDSGYPDEEYWKFDGERDERIGMCNRSDANSYCNDSQVKRLLYSLPTPYQDASITVLSATFKVTMVHTYDSSARAVSLYRMGAGISSGTNWRNQPAWSKKQDTRSPTAKQSSCTSTNQNVTFTATQAAQDAALYNWSTTTFGLRADDETSKYFIKRFCDNAVLSVNYNRPPAAPTTLTSNPGGGCHTGTPNNSWYVSSVPKLSAYLSDPDTADAEPLTARFTVTWTPVGGTLQSKLWTSGAKANKSTFDYNLADASTGVPNLPENVVVSWYVEAYDGTSWSAKSTTCGFILDKTKPAGADIDSPEYLAADAGDSTPACVEDDEWVTGVGRYGTFTFDSAASDVAYYKYGFDGSANTVLTPATNGGPVTVSWMPLTEAPHFVNVIAVDVAGKESDVSSCTFRVGPGAGPAGQWKLDDVAGAAQAADTAGSSPAAAGSGVTFEYAGPGGPAHRSALLNGTGNGYLSTATTKVVDTSQPFTVSAWVKLNDLTKIGAAVSQNGTGEPGFVLGYNAYNGKWNFRIAATDLDALNEWVVYSTESATTGWTHLTGSVDPYTNTMKIYVNGQLSGSVAARSAWASHGRLQIGRRLTKTGYIWPWYGGIADVVVHGRALIPEEIGQLAEPRLQRQVYWAMDSNVAVDGSPGTWTIAEDVVEGMQADPAKDLTLHDTDGLYTPDLENEPWLEYPLVGAGHMNLNGVNEYAATSLPLAGTTGSFSVTARAKLAAECTSNQAVLSQPGANVSRFVVRCADIGGGQRRWQLAVAATDSASTAWTVVTNDLALPDPTDPDGSHLTVTYNAFTERVQLYVDGQLAAAAGAPHSTAWPGPDNGLQIGRALTGPQTYGHYFSGILDEVRVYTGVLDQVTILRLASLTPQSDI